MGKQQLRDALGAAEMDAPTPLADADRLCALVAASSGRVTDLEAFQVQRARGRCHTCDLDGQPVNVPDLAAAAASWPEFAAVA